MSRQPGRPLARPVVIPLAAAAGVLVVVGPALRYWAAVRRRSDPTESALLPTLFDVNTEANVPSWFSATLWVLASGTAAGIAAAGTRPRTSRRRGWVTLAAVFALLSLDEAAALHERVLDPVGAALLGDNRQGVLHFAWVLPGVLVAAVLVLAVAGTVRAMPPRSRRLVLLAGAVYVSGAVVAESLSGAALERYGDARAYVALTSLEEAAEMAGALLLLYALLLLVTSTRDPAGGLRLNVPNLDQPARSDRPPAHAGRHRTVPAARNEPHP